MIGLTSTGKLGLIENMPMTHTVKQGECLSSIAARYGFADYKVIYDHPDNADFKKKRPNPNVIFPGDVLAIPDKAEKEQDCATGQLTKFKLKVPRTKIRLEIDLDASHDYELTVGNEKFTGTTDGKSPIEHEVSALVMDGHLELWLTKEEGAEGDSEEREGLISWDLRIGALDPIEEVSGVKARLSNLGYYLGAVDNQVDETLGLSVAAFEEDMGLAITGDVGNQKMRDKLLKEHDGP